MARTTTPAQAQPLRTCTHVRVRYLLCAVSVLALGPVTLPAEFSPISSALAQQVPNATTEELFLAVERNDLEAVRTAVNKGADIEARDFSGTQPVDMAIDRGYFEVARYLISVRNARTAQQDDIPPPAAPSMDEQTEPFAEPLAQDSVQTPPPPVAVPTPPVEQTQISAPPAPPKAPQSSALSEGIQDPFDTTQAADALPVLGDIQEPDPDGSSNPFEMEPTPSTQSTKQPRTPLVTELDSPLADIDPFSEFEISDASPEETQVPPSPSSLSAKAPPEPAPEKAVQIEAVPEKPSAAKTFVATFLDFFKPPNVTGVVRREDNRNAPTDVLSETELARQLQEIESERGDDVIKGPDVPISPEELALELPPSPEVPDVLSSDELASAATDSELPPYVFDTPTAPVSNVPQTTKMPVTTTESPTTEAPPTQDDIFADMVIENAEAIYAQPDFKEAPGVPGKRYNASLPFGGGVDPDILDYLNLDRRTGITSAERESLDEDWAKLAMAANTQSTPTTDPEAPPVEDDDPFALLDTPDESASNATPDVSDLLDGLDEPQSVAALDPQSPPSRASEDDNPFAAPAEGEVDELAGLLESTGENVSGTQGWDVTEVEEADLPSEVVILTDIEPTGKTLDGVELAIGADTVIGQGIGEERLKQMELETIHKPCLSKGEVNTVFCVDKVSWPFEMEEDFLVDTIMYQGTRAISRYDAGHASHFHTLFRSTSFDKVASYYTQRYGQPSEIIQRAIAPLAAPRQDNPTYLWQSREPGTDTIITLEIRKFDDAQGGGFPDTKRGVILLYRSHAKPIFPQLSQLELMVLKEESSDTTFGESGPDTPGSIW